MPNSKAAAPLPPTNEMPAWKRRSIERSVQAATARAQSRSDRFVAAALELMAERGSTDFTVQEVIERSRMSIRTFYKHFPTKDDLLVALHETILANEVVPRLRKRCAAEADPVLRIRAYIDGMFKMTAKVNPVSHALTTYRNRLAETRPQDLDRAFKPQIDLVADLLESAAAAGRLSNSLPLPVAAHLVHQTVLGVVHARILRVEGSGAVSVDELWQFCASGLGVMPPQAD